MGVEKNGVLCSVRQESFNITVGPVVELPILLDTDKSNQRSAWVIRIASQALW